MFCKKCGKRDRRQRDLLHLLRRAAERRPASAGAARVFRECAGRRQQFRMGVFRIFNPACRSDPVPGVEGHPAPPLQIVRQRRARRRDPVRNFHHHLRRHRRLRGGERVRLLRGRIALTKKEPFAKRERLFLFQQIATRKGDGLFAVVVGERRQLAYAADPQP